VEEMKEDKMRQEAQGQTIVIFALMLVTLIAFVGIAVDVGFGFVRSSQFSAAVDAAALAGAVDLDPQSEDDTTEADIRAGQFLGANGWPLDEVVNFDSGRSYTDRGIPEYTITVTWTVETFFMRIFGIEGFPITRAATAAYYAQAELYVPTAFDRSHLRKANLFAFGPAACTFAGDPVSPLFSINNTTPNEDYAVANGIYRFRFRIPGDYPHNNIRVELFDPDSVNHNINSASITIQRSNTYSNTTGIGTEVKDCPVTNQQSGQACVIRTDEGVQNLETIFYNPFWFVRVDETWDGSCTPVPANPAGNTTTKFELYYYNAQGARIRVGEYIERNNRLNDTDLRWVSPGTTGPLGNVPVPADFGSFELDITAVPTGLGNARYIYLDVKTESGNSKNGFDVRAGLPNSELPPDWTNYNHVNERNLYLANNAAFDPSGGIQTFALGRLPLQHLYGNNALNLPLVPVDTVLADGVIYATLFDFEGATSSPSPPPEIEFTIDSVPLTEFRMFARVTN
jgi:hypothetical protein